MNGKLKTVFKAKCFRNTESMLPQDRCAMVSGTTTYCWSWKRFRIDGHESSQFSSLVGLLSIIKIKESEDGWWEFPTDP